MGVSDELVIRGGTVVTAERTYTADIAINRGVITNIGSCEPGVTNIDASNLLVLPGGVDGHCHIEQRSAVGGVMNADDFLSGTMSAAFGGTTTVIPFAAQYRGDSVGKAIDSYHQKALNRSFVDYGFHLILSDPTPQVLNEEIPRLESYGITSLKIYMTYDALRLTDRQILEVLVTAKRYGLSVMVHAENHDMIEWLADAFILSGRTSPTYHGKSHVVHAEREATYRALQLAEVTDSSIIFVHVSERSALAHIERVQSKGQNAIAETCPHYLVLTGKEMDRAGLEGAKFCCSPPLRSVLDQEALWQGIRSGSVFMINSDHAPYRFDQTGKLRHGPNSNFKQIANGLPGIELRLPLLFSEGVNKDRISLERFVELSSTNAAKLYNLFPRKGVIAVGSDADLCIWDPSLERTVEYSDLHDNAGYTPYEGLKIRGWPITVLSRGALIVSNRKLVNPKPNGKFIHRTRPGQVRSHL